MAGLFGDSEDKGEKELMMEKFRKQRKTPNKEKNFHNQKKIIISGENGVGKSSLALSLLAQDLKEDEVICLIDIDGSCTEIAETFYPDEYYNDQIIIYQAEAKKITKEGAEVIDEKTTVLGVTTIASEIKEAIDEGIKVKGVIVDGISNVLRYSEDKMRDEKNLDAGDGVQMNMWKIRNAFFRQCTNAYKILPTPVLYITHEEFIPEILEKGQVLSEVKRNLIDDCSGRLYLRKEVDPSNENVVNHIAEIRKNRSNIFNVGKSVTFMSVNYKEEIVETKYKELSDLLFNNPIKKTKE